MLDSDDVDWLAGNAHSHLWHLSSTKYSLSLGSYAKVLVRLIFWPDDGAGWKVRCLWGTQRCVPDFTAISPKVEIFHSFSKNIHPAVGTLHLVPPAGWVHHLGTMNIYTSIWASPFSWCWDISKDNKYDLLCAFNRSPRWLRFILWGPWMSTQNVTLLCILMIFVKCFKDFDIPRAMHITKHNTKHNSAVIINKLKKKLCQTNYFRWLVKVSFSFTWLKNVMVLVWRCVIYLPQWLWWGSVWRCIKDCMNWPLWPEAVATSDFEPRNCCHCLLKPKARLLCSSAQWKRDFSALS